ncbi:MAG: type II secretion system protein, partial [Alteromonadales bacterium]|nr:type II secretion system protein [Alteromonadales bacterium]
MFSKKYTQSLMAKFSKIDTKDIADKGLRNKATKLLGKQAGFTLLELLVVVAILAAIAGTASIALQDTDARASAAAHVTMMDELNKGIRTYRVLRKNSLPNNFDSLLEKADTATASAAGAFAGGALGANTSVLGFEDGLATIALNDGMAGILNDGGITELR